jgi:hypothetical protein
MVLQTLESWYVHCVLQHDNVQHEVQQKIEKAGKFADEKRFFPKARVAQN